MTEWRKYKDTDYWVSRSGKVKHKGKEIGTFQDNGYCVIRFGREGGTVKRNVMVAQTYLDWFEGCQVHHKNGKKTDDRASNLVCLTPLQHMAIHGLVKIVGRVNNGVIDRVYNSAALAEEELGLTINHSHIGRCINGLQETCAGYRWVGLDYSEFDCIFVADRNEQSAKELIYKRLFGCLDGVSSPPSSTEKTNVDLNEVFKGFLFN